MTDPVEIRCVPAFLASEVFPENVAILVDTSETLKGVHLEDGTVRWETLEEYAMRLSKEGKACKILLTVEDHA